MDNKAERERGLAAQREYLREWRKRNPDKVKAARERYWIRWAERHKQEGR